MDWWLWVLLIVVLGAVSDSWWRSSGRTPEQRERGEHRPGGESQFGKWGMGGGGGG